MPASSFSIVVLISGEGSNLQAIIDQVQNHKLNLKIACVISNKENAFGLARAQRAEIETQTMSHKDYGSREDYDKALAKVIDRYTPDLIVLAGFMRILSAEFVRIYMGKLINIHPSLLPKYQGLNTHQRAIEAGENFHGASVHFVTPGLDSGPVLLQGRVQVIENDNAEELAKRVHIIEHQIYPMAIEWIVNQRVYMNNTHQLFFDNLPLIKPIQIDTNGC